jgi:hypothetical protein
MKIGCLILPHYSAGRRVGWCFRCDMARSISSLRPVSALIDTLLIPGALMCRDVHACAHRVHVRYHGGASPVPGCSHCERTRPYPEPPVSPSILELEALLRGNPWVPVPPLAPDVTGG